MIDIFFADPSAAASLRQTRLAEQVYCLERDFSQGDIAADDDAPQALLAQIAAGEPLRLWLNNKATDMCGFYWLLHWLYLEKLVPAEVSVVRLPWFEERPDGVVVIAGHWGETLPERAVWQHYFALAQKLPANFILGAALAWQDMQRKTRRAGFCWTGICWAWLKIFMIIFGGDF